VLGLSRIDGFYLIKMTVMSNDSNYKTDLMQIQDTVVKRTTKLGIYDDGYIL